MWTNNFCLYLPIDWNPAQSRIDCRINKKSRSQKRNERVRKSLSWWHPWKVSSGVHSFIKVRFAVSRLNSKLNSKSSQWPILERVTVDNFVWVACLVFDWWNTSITDYSEWMLKHQNSFDCWTETLVLKSWSTVATVAAETLPRAGLILGSLWSCLTLSTVNNSVVINHVYDYQVVDELTLVQQCTKPIRIKLLAPLKKSKAIEAEKSQTCLRQNVAPVSPLFLYSITLLAIFLPIPDIGIGNWQ